MEKMSYDEEATLLTRAGCAQDAEGFRGSDQWHRTPIFAGKKSAGRQEDYGAMRAGKKVALVLGMQTSEYEAGILETGANERVYPTRVEYEGRIYRILRSYGEEKEEMELVLEDNTDG